MPKTVEDKVQRRSMHTKHKGADKRSNPIGTHREQSHDSGELPFIQLEAKIIELSVFIKDKHKVHQTMKNMVTAIGILCNRLLEIKKSKERPKPAVPIISQSTHISSNYTSTELRPSKRGREKRKSFIL